jgi:hypothetical protein
MFHVLDQFYFPRKIIAAPNGMHALGKNNEPTSILTGHVYPRDTQHHHPISHRDLWTLINNIPHKQSD